MKLSIKLLFILIIMTIPVSAFSQGTIDLEKRKNHSHQGKIDYNKKKDKNTDDSYLGKPKNLESVDLGLPSGIKWASCNIGAKTPSDYGSYFSWGEIHTKKDYDESNSLTYGRTFGDIGGNKEFDAARANWGGKWRLPTKGEFEELLNYCTWTFITMDGHNGYKVTGSNGKYIFLPAAGYRYGSLLNFAGKGGFYWSSSPNGSKYSYYLYFNRDDRNVFYGIDRDNGQSVRPVSE